MDCNKEEAIRAKGLAEQKMQEKDFAGAYKLATKAQRLHESVENISQMLMVCKVHCTAEQKVGGHEMDWYGILQVEHTVDEGAIKKQYKKLALQLHPDKNQFPGAEAAFKLIGEAQALLLDKGKRSLHDVKRRASAHNPVPPFKYQPGGTYSRNANLGVQNNPRGNFTGNNPQDQRPQQPATRHGFSHGGVQNNARGNFTGNNLQDQRPQQPASGHGFSHGHSTFWTMCPFCTLRHQRFIDSINKLVDCMTCHKAFVACQVMPGPQPQPNSNRATFWTMCTFCTLRHQRFIDSINKLVDCTRCRKAFVACQVMPGPQPEPNSNQATFPKRKDASGPSGCDLKSKTQSNSKTEHLKPENSTKKVNGKRKRKHYESSSSNSDEKAPMEDGDSKVKVDAQGSADRVRRSARSKEQVSYKENLHDNDGVYMDILSDDDGVEEVKDNSKKSKGSDVSSVSQGRTGNRLKKKSPVKPCGVAANMTVQEEADNKVTSDDEQDFKTDGTSSSSSDSEHPQRPEPVVCPDPEFHDFDSERSESRFSQGQIWALYDELDVMPRFYARIQKVFSPGFKLNIRWLEHCPDEKDERAWVCDDFSPACGEFKLGKTLKVESCDLFSHLVLEKCGRVSTHKIFPRKGEVWALFRNWEAIWKSGPVANRVDYEFAEILSDFSEDEGACVAFLDKMEGFVSLFCQTKKENMNKVQIPPKELIRFSHMVPYSTKTGEEREGVPRGSLELDPAALPPTCQ